MYHVNFSKHVTSLIYFNERSRRNFIIIMINWVNYNMCVSARFKSVSNIVFDRSKELSMDGSLVYQEPFWAMYHVYKLTNILTEFAQRDLKTCSVMASYIIRCIITDTLPCHL